MGCCPCHTCIGGSSAEPAGSRGARSRSPRLVDHFQEDLTFHRMLWEVADNGYAARALETVLGSLFASGLIGSRHADSIDLRLEAEKHRRLLEAVCDADGQRAALCLLEIASGFEKHLG